MKIIFFLLTVLTTMSSFGQTYYPFPTDSATWSVEEYTYGWFPEPDGCIAKHYGLVGDTIINGKIYSKLYGNNLPGDYPYSDTAFNISTATYVAAVREDTAKKIWIRESNDTIDILYYDFALNIGDTFCFNYFDIGCYSVSYVDSIIINGNYRRQIHFETFNPETWIDGIGSTTGWFQWQFVGSWSWRLLCYQKNQNQFYGDSYCNCDSYTGIRNLNKEKAEIKVYPNPTTTNINIEIKTHLFDKYNINIYSMLGQNIKTVRSDKNLILIDINDFTEGIYFIVVTNNEEKRWTYKIIKNAPQQ